MGGPAHCSSAIVPTGPLQSAAALQPWLILASLRLSMPSSNCELSSVVSNCRQSPPPPRRGVERRVEYPGVVLCVLAATLNIVMWHAFTFVAVWMHCRLLHVSIARVAAAAIFKQEITE